MNQKYDQEFLSKLKELCLEYDKHAEEFPESTYEGFAIYYFASNYGSFVPDNFGIAISDHEGGNEWLKELGIDDE